MRCYQSPTTPPESDSERPGIAVVAIAAGIGAAALIAGGALLVSAQLDLGRAPARDDGVSLLSPTLENRGTLAGIQTKRSIGSVLAIGGGVVAITAVILFFVSPPTDPSNSISLMPQVSVGPTVGGAAGSLLWRLP
jgi:hypothetical protein